MAYRVFLIEEAEKDIYGIVGYIAKYDSPEKAEKILDGLEAACAGLKELPGRGVIPKELEAIGIGIYRELHFKPYRIIYEVRVNEVYVHAVLDGRRDMPTLLEQRVLM